MAREIPMKKTGRAETGDAVRSLFARAFSRATLPYLATGVLLLIAVIVIGQEIEQHVAVIEQTMQTLGVWGAIAFVALYAVLTSCLVPDTVLCIIAGALFGFGWGVGVSVAGGLLAAVLQFSLARKTLRPPIQRSVAGRPALAAIQRAVIRDELRLQVLLRLTPLSPATISYLLGAAGVRFSGFLVACFAMTPYLFLEVYFGHAGTRMARIAGGDVKSGRLYALALLAGLAVLVLVMVRISRTARKAVLESVAETENVS
jgi:uncharacterized membrane protein YdjX (TVP38/TMEM64 family)